MDPFSLDGRSLDTDLLILRSLFAIDSNTNLPIPSQYLLTADGQGGLIWQSVFDNISTMSAQEGSGLGYLPSTIFSFSTSILSYSSILGTGFSTLAQDIANGGIPGSITGPQLQSTVTSIFNPATYISTGNLFSTAAFFLNNDFAEGSSNSSTILGQGFISTGQFSTFLSTSAAFHQSSLTSTVAGLATAGYISSSQLQSTVFGLGNFGYVSSAALRSTTSTILQTTATNLTSSLVGLGTFGYVSTPTLLSSTDGLLRNINVDRAGNLIVYNSRVTISSLQSLAFLSTFTNSSIMYRGTNGPTIASTTNRDLYWSTAQLQFNSHSNYITPSTQITVDIFPTYVFCGLNLINTTQIYEMSTMIQYRNTIVPQTITTSYMVANGFQSGYSNFYNTPIRLHFNASTIMNNFAEQYVVSHRLINCLSSNLQGGIQNSNMMVYMASTNSVFLSFQNQVM